MCVLPATEVTGGSTQGGGRPVPKLYVVSRREWRTYLKQKKPLQQAGSHYSKWLISNVSELLEQWHWKLMNLITHAELFWFKKFRAYYGVDTASTLVLGYTQSRITTWH